MARSPFHNSQVNCVQLTDLSSFPHYCILALPIALCCAPQPSQTQWLQSIQTKEFQM